MISLLKVACAKKNVRILLSLALLFMLLLTLASQLEIFALGILTKKGPTFFELFSKEEGLKSAGDVVITKENLLHTFSEMDANHKGFITKEDVTAFVKRNKRGDFLTNTLSFVEQFIPITSSTYTLALFLLFVALFKATTLFFQRYTSKLVAIYVSKDLRERYFHHIQTLPMSFYAKYNAGTLSSSVTNDAMNISEAIGSTITNYVQTPLVVATTLTLCFLTSWQLSLIVFLGFPLIVIPIIYIAGKVRALSRQLQRSQESFSEVLLDFLSGVQTVKVFSMEHLSMSKYQKMNNEMAKYERRAARFDLISRPLVHTIAMFFLSGALIYGLYVLEMSVSLLFFFCGLLYVFYEPIKKFAEENSRIQKGIAAFERMEKVMKLKPEIVDKEDALAIDGFHSEIVFDRVSFSYQQKQVLNNVSFRIKKGESVALVGPTGAGKSTIAMLLPRLYEPTSGEIRIDSTPIQNIKMDSLKKLIAMVPQRAFLFNDTVKNNICFGKEATFNEVQRASSLSLSDEFILEMENGYDTVIRESGRELSGGQLQRLSIARALIKKAPIMILDEATSSLDTLSEQKVKESIDLLKGEVTQIIIAHRLSTIESVDRVIYIEGGEVVADGTIDELLETCTPFKMMWERRGWRENAPL